MTDAAPETAAEAETSTVPETGSALVVYVNEHPAIVLLDEGRREKFFEAIKAEVSSHVPDLTTAKGRDAIRSLAMKVTKTKTAIDNAGKKLKEEAQKTVQAVDAARRSSRETLEPLAVEVRAPLTDWEERETLRIARADGIIEGLRNDAVVKTTETAEDVGARLERLEAQEIDPETMGDRTELAQELHDAAVASLRGAVARIRQEEADRAELEALRAEKAEADRLKAEAEAAKAAKIAAYEAAKAEARAAAEREAQRVLYVEQTMKHITDCGLGMIGGTSYPYVILIRELEEKIVRDDKLAPDWEKIDQHRLETLARVRAAFAKDQERAAAEAQQAEALRVETARREAAEEAHNRARAAAEDARNAEIAEHNRALEAEKRRADEAEAKRQREAAQAAEEQRQREVEAEAKRKADEARAADQEHRGRIMGGAKEALIELGADEALARTIVLAIAAGHVPAVSIRF